ncbi:hypothetical protein T459_34833 [Capsicum annuum]|uniref:NB-ARC domain-containing protein n=1 Tax=Capsicum annuum TaxID=4072 RepID=A0A2G2XV07_CAPAN|nr:hypothetical protein T459_34833 [Capsicum annuum]
MDDIWSSKAWDDVKQCFLMENNESRILLTTRNNEVACYAGTENLSLQISFVDQDECWNLVKNAAFANETLPSEFETIGKQIVDKLQGLPLTIVVFAGLLRKSKRIIEDWETVAENVNNLLKQTHSIFSFCRYSSVCTLESELKHFKLLRISDLGPIMLDNFPPQILYLVLLRYLCLPFRQLGLLLVHRRSLL